MMIAVMGFVVRLVVMIVFSDDVCHEVCHDWVCGDEVRSDD